MQTRLQIPQRNRHSMQMRCDDANGASSNELLPTHRRLALPWASSTAHTAVADDAGPLSQSDGKGAHLFLASALYLGDDSTVSPRRAMTMVHASHALSRVCSCSFIVAPSRCAKQSTS
jgi:hypothetical protein